MDTVDKELGFMGKLFVEEYSEKTTQIVHISVDMEDEVEDKSQIRLTGQCRSVG